MNCEDYRIHDGVIVVVQHDLPTVGIIRRIFIINGDTVIFTVDHYTTSFEPHYRAYFLDETPFSSANILHSDYLYNSQFIFKLLVCMNYQVIL